MSLSFFKYFQSSRIFIVITLIILFFISISSYYFFIDNSNKINNIALQNIEDTTELQSDELATSLSNRVATITKNLPQNQNQVLE